MVSRGVAGVSVGRVGSAGGVGVSAAPHVVSAGVSVFRSTPAVARPVMVAAARARVARVRRRGFFTAEVLFGVCVFGQKVTGRLTRYLCSVPCCESPGARCASLAGDAGWGEDVEFRRRGTPHR